MMRACTLTAVTLSGILALTGCTSTPTPPAPLASSRGASTSATVTPSASAATPSASPKAQTATPATTQIPLPKVATLRTRAGALAFVRHYLAVYNEVSVRPRAGAIKGLSAPGCRTCAGMESTQVAFVKNRSRYATTPTRVDLVTASPEADPRRSPFRAVAHLSTLGSKVVDRDGTVLRTERKKNGTLSFYLVWRPAGNPSGWRVQEIKFVG